MARTTEEDYVFVTRAERGCASVVGRQGGRQELRLGPDCLRFLGLVLHEFMHTLGPQPFRLPPRF